MTELEIQELLPTLIEQAKKLSKEKFLTFAENMYGIDRSKYDFLWQTQIVPMDDLSTIFPVDLTTYTTRSLKSFIGEHIGDDDAVFIPHATFLNSLPDNARDEYLTGIQTGMHTQMYDSIILYNPQNLRELFDLIQSSGERHSISQERINNDFVVEVSKIFGHEHIHNANRHVPSSTSELEVESDQETLIRQGARLEFSDDPNFKVQFENHDEVLTDVMAKIIKLYSPGDSIEDCLHKVILGRDREDPYKDLDDRPVLALFVLFPDELSSWTMHQRFDDTYHNLLLEKYVEIVQSERTATTEEVLQKAYAYLQETGETLSPETLARRQEMLFTLAGEEIDLEAEQDYDYDNDSDFDALLAIIFSDAAIQELPGAIQDIKTAQKQLVQNKPAHDKEDIEP